MMVAVGDGDQNQSPTNSALSSVVSWKKHKDDEGRMLREGASSPLTKEKRGYLRHDGGSNNNGRLVDDKANGFCASEPEEEEDNQIESEADSTCLQQNETCLHDEKDIEDNPLLESLGTFLNDICVFEESFSTVDSPVAFLPQIYPESDKNGPLGNGHRPLIYHKALPVKSAAPRRKEEISHLSSQPLTHLSEDNREQELGAALEQLLLTKKSAAKLAEDKHLLEKELRACREEHQIILNEYNVQSHNFEKEVEDLKEAHELKITKLTTIAMHNRDEAQRLSEDIEELNAQILVLSEQLREVNNQSTANQETVPLSSEHSLGLELLGGTLESLRHQLFAREEELSISRAEVDALREEFADTRAIMRSQALTYEHSISDHIKLEDKYKNELEEEKATRGQLQLQLEGLKSSLRAMGVERDELVTDIKAIQDLLKNEKLLHQDTATLLQQESSGRAAAEEAAEAMKKERIHLKAESERLMDEAEESARSAAEKSEVYAELIDEQQVKRRESTAIAQLQCENAQLRAEAESIDRRNAELERWLKIERTNVSEAKLKQTPLVQVLEERTLLLQEEIAKLQRQITDVSNDWQTKLVSSQQSAAKELQFEQSKLKKSEAQLVEIEKQWTSRVNELTVALAQQQRTAHESQEVNAKDKLRAKEELDAKIAEMTVHIKKRLTARAEAAKLAQRLEALQTQVGTFEEGTFETLKGLHFTLDNSREVLQDLLSTSQSQPHQSLDTVNKLIYELKSDWSREDCNSTGLARIEKQVDALSSKASTINKVLEDWREFLQDSGSAAVLESKDYKPSPLAQLLKPLTECFSKNSKIWRTSSSVNYSHIEADSSHTPQDCRVLLGRMQDSDNSPRPSQPTESFQSLQC